ncbi:transposase [Luteolibacter arcticus]|uniref:transposase n=1 Tax=Luteolibacter arcticus TaxID=1581411 RepID=UPI0034E066E6
MSWISRPRTSRTPPYESEDRRRYTAEFNAQSVELLETGRPVAELGGDLGISTKPLYSWKQASERSQVGSGRPRAEGKWDAADELRALRREVAPLRVNKDIFENGRDHPPHQTPAGLRAMIDGIRATTGHGVRRTCDMLCVPRSWPFCFPETPTQPPALSPRMPTLVRSLHNGRRPLLSRLSARLRFPRRSRGVPQRQRRRRKILNAFVAARPASPAGLPPPLPYLRAGFDCLGSWLAVRLWATSSNENPKLSFVVRVHRLRAAAGT